MAVEFTSDDLYEIACWYGVANFEGAQPHRKVFLKVAAELYRIDRKAFNQCFSDDDYFSEEEMNDIRKNVE